MAYLGRWIVATAMLVSLPAAAQQSANKVDRIYLNSSPNLAGTCHPTRVRFDGSIHATGPLYVTYQWVRSDNKHTDATLTFDAEANRTISTEWDLTASYTGWVQLIVLTPKRIESKKVHFHVNCG
jgi:hypothetical protein